MNVEDNFDHDWNNQIRSVTETLGGGPAYRHMLRERFAAGGIRPITARLRFDAETGGDPWIYEQWLAFIEKYDGEEAVRSRLRKRQPLWKRILRPLVGT